MQNITARQYNCLMDFTCAWEETSPFAFSIPLRALAVCMSVMKSHKMGCIFYIVNSETATVWQIWVHTIGHHLFYYYSNYLFFSICKWNSRGFSLCVIEASSQRAENIPWRFTATPGMLSLCFSFQSHTITKMFWTRWQILRSPRMQWQFSHRLCTNTRLRPLNV